MAASSLLLEAGIMFAALALAGIVASRIRQSVIPLYIVVGMLIGPYSLSIGGVSLQLVEAGEFIDLLAELGIVFLLFFLGLEFSLDTLLSNRSRITRAGVVDFAINFPIGLGLGLLFGFSLLESLFVAGIVYVSSSAVISKSLIDLNWIADPEAEAVLGVLVFEDILVAFYLAVLSAVAFGGDGLLTAATSVASAMGFLLVLLVGVRYGTAWFERALDTTSDEFFLLRVVALTVLVAAAALLAGLSEAVAAFFVGMAVSETSHDHRIERIVAPSRDLFAAVFFFSIGLTTDPALVLDVAPLLVVFVVVTALAKLASGFLSGRSYGLDRRRSVRVAAAMVARGEFSLVIAALAVTAGSTPVLAETIPALTVGYVLVMSILGTVLMRYSGVGERLVATPNSRGVKS